jgi:hypothetical protein
VQRTANRSSASLRAFSSSEPLVLFRVNEEDKIGTITLNSPNTLNALTVEMGHDFQALVRQIHHDLYSIEKDSLNVNAIVLEGAGDSAFSAGGNVEWLKGLKHNPVYINADAMISFYRSFLCIRQVRPGNSSYHLLKFMLTLSFPARCRYLCLSLRRSRDQQ